jgi:arylsulfatase A-like enzyme
LADIAPTLLYLMNLKAPPEMDGQILVSWFSGKINNKNKAVGVNYSINSPGFFYEKPNNKHEVSKIIR